MGANISPERGLSQSRGTYERLHSFMLSKRLFEIPINGKDSARKFERFSFWNEIIAELPSKETKVGELSKIVMQIIFVIPVLNGRMSKTALDLKNYRLGSLRMTKREKSANAKSLARCVSRHASSFLETVPLTQYEFQVGNDIVLDWIEFC
jgi:hypothetical protein